MLKSDLSSLEYTKLLSEARDIRPETLRRRIRLALLTDASPQYFEALFKVLFARAGYAVDYYAADFDQIEAEALEPGSGLYAHRPEVVVILRATQPLKHRFFSSKADRGVFAETELERIRSVWAAISSRSEASILQGNFVLPSERIFGNLDRRVEGSLIHTVSKLNALLQEAANSVPGVFVSDLDLLASLEGRKHWLDEKLWGVCKAFCSFKLLPRAVQNVVDTCLSLKGAVVKCVVTDLDNTLWGGVIGDDGLEGIRIGHFEDGEAYLDLQHYLLELKKRGVILAVCSKNEPEAALLPFQKHPDMILRETDFAVFAANWSNKAENLKIIRETLNIGYDSIVFLDDNPFERNLVRQALPEVLVPEIPEDPAKVVGYLSELNLFETTSFSAADAQRAEQYRVEAERRLAEKSFSTPEEYLKSLGMKITFARFDAFNLPRIAQLIQRSNQFNLMTQRFNEAQCEHFRADRARYFPFYLKLEDKYGDSGLISAVILEFSGDEVRVLEWIMSCRVLSRGVEQYAMNAVFEAARRRGAKCVIGTYRPTEKNKMVREFFGSFGFARTGEQADGTAVWALETGRYEPRAVYFENEERIDTE